MRRVNVLLLIVLGCVMSAAVSVRASAASDAKRTRTITLTETAGVARTNYPVEVTVRYESGAVAGPNALGLFRVTGGEKIPVSFQVISVHEPNVTNAPSPGPQTFVRIAFLADVLANGRAVYEVTEAASDAPPVGKGLSVSGEGEGRYEELKRWQRILSSPLMIVAD